MTPPSKQGSPWPIGMSRHILRSVQPSLMTVEERFEFSQFLLRVRYFVVIKGAFDALIIVLYLLVLRPELRIGPVLVAMLDGLLLLPYIFLVRRWPTLSTYILLSTTALAISIADIAAGYQTNTSGVLYALLIMGGAVLLMERRGITAVTTLVTVIYLITYALEITGVVPVDMVLTRRAVIRVVSFNTMAFVSVGILSNILIQLYRQLMQTRVQRGLLTTLLEGFREISGDLHLHTLLQRIVERAVSTIPAADRAILLVREDDRVVVRGTAGYGNLSLQGLALPWEEILPYLEQYPVQRADLLQLFQVHYPEEANRFQSLPLGRTTAILPLKLKSAFYGLLVVTSSRAADAFDANTLRLMNLFAHQAAVGVENAHLFAEAQSRLQETQTLSRIGQEITGRLQTRDLVLVIYRHIQDAIEAPSLFIAALDPDSGEIVVRSPMDFGQLLPDTAIPAEGIFGWVMRHQRPLRWGNVPRDLEAYPEIRPHRIGSEDPETLSLLAVPLLVEDRVIGALSVQSTKANAYDERAERFLFSLASYVAVAVQNAQLYDEVQKKAQELQRQQEELQNLVAIVSQRLQGPVEALTGFARLLKEGATDRLTSIEGDYLERIARNSRWVSQLIRDMRFLSQVDQIGEETEPISLTTLMRGVGTNLGLEEQGINLEVQEGMPVLYADPVLMWALFRHLLQNTQKLLHSSRFPRIEVGCEALASSYRLHVRGNGEALSPEDLERIFDLFYPVGRAGSEEPGIGLTIARRIGQRYAGRVWAESKDGKGTTFYALLPRELGQVPEGVVHD